MIWLCETAINAMVMCNVHFIDTIIPGQHLGRPLQHYIYSIYNNLPKNI
jgi:hypothetical protein